MAVDPKTAKTRTMPGPAGCFFPVPADSQETGRWLRQLLGHLLDSLEADEAGLSRLSPPARLHGYRIALRRARSLLSAFADALPGEFAALAPDLRWIAGISGRARDLDVHLRDLAALDVAPEGAAVIRSHLERQRTKAYAALRRALQTRRYQQLKARWRAALAIPPAGKAERKPIARMAKRRIGRIRSKLLRQGRRISPASGAEELHDLRKRGKKLRYMLEFFPTLYPDQVIRRELKDLKALQAVLGRFQDLENQRLLLENLAETLPIEGSRAALAKTSLHALAETGARCQHDCRLGFAEAFERFLSRAREGG